MKRIILISSIAQGGKTSTANILKKELENEGYKCAIVPLAKHLKRLLIDFYGWDGKDKSPKWRDMLQVVGSDIIRDKLNKPMYHCSRLCEDVSIVQDNFDFILVDDVRFEGEAFYIKAYYPQKVSHIKINRLNFKSPLTESQQNHQSERGMDGYENYDYTIKSESGLKNLEKAILESGIIEDITGSRYQIVEK